MEYPKIETLFDRSEKFAVIPGQLRCPEFGLVKQWLVTEKIDGTNVRVHFQPQAEVPVEFFGRTAEAQMPTFLLSVLQRLFMPAVIAAAFEPDVTDVWLFGEGYGPKIQKGGGSYRHQESGTSFRLFDVRVGEWWLNWPDVAGIAAKLGIQTVPDWEVWSIGEIVAAVESGRYSAVATEEGTDGHIAEGVVARTDPLLFDRRGRRVMWKLKTSDFKEGRR